MQLEHRLSALLQLHLHSRLNTWLHWIGQRQLQDETRNIEVWGFGAAYIRYFTVVLSTFMSYSEPFFQRCFTDTLGLCSLCYNDRIALNTLRSRQNGRHFTDDIFKCIFLSENVWILIKISLKFVPKGPINNIPALIQIIVCADQATSHYLKQWWLVYWRI